MEKYKKKICIIGAGTFGCTIASKLAENKNFKIDLFEKENDILKGVSFKNQQRFHRGYHYPRSERTIKEVKNSYNKFLKYFGSNIFGKTINLYGISRQNSLITYKEYLNLLKKNNLKIVENKKYKIFSKYIEGSIITNEKNLNFFKFKKVVQKKLKKKNIKIFLNSKIKKIDIKKYNKIILACYFNNNNILSELGIGNKKIKKRRYELIEKIIVKLPSKFQKMSAVILDGNFLNFDPFVGTNYHLLSVVKPAKIEIQKSKFLKLKNTKKNLINFDYIKNKKNSNFKKFINLSKKFVPELIKAQYVKSYYTIRCVNNAQNSHQRLNEILIYNKNIISVIAGKWNTVVDVADKIKKIIR